MSKLFPRLMLVAAIGLTGAACQDDGYAAPRGYYQQAQYGYSQPPYGYSQPPYGNSQPQYGNSQPAPYYNQNDGRRYTTVTVTNRGQNGNRDDVVQQTVACGSQYYDGYRTRIARC